jgi:two-component system chemotaxis response regulator CheY
MPTMDGIETLKNIKQYNPNAKVIMIAAMGQQNQVIESIQLGAKDFIVKPLKNERLIEVVKKIINE